MDRVACWTPPGDVHGLGLAGGQGFIHLQRDEYEVWNRQKPCSEPQIPSSRASRSSTTVAVSSNKQTWSKACRSRFVHADLRSVGGLKGTTSLRCRTRFVACCRTSARRRASRPRPTLASKSVERASRPHPFLAFRNNAAEDDVSEELVPICCRIWDGEQAVAWDENGDCFPADNNREDGAFATAVWHREDIPDLQLEVPATWITDDTIQKPGARCVITSSFLFPILG